VLDHLTILADRVLPGPVGGHLWSVAPKLWHKAIRLQAPASAPWSASVPDPDRGEVRLTGLLRERPESDTLVLVIHGIGGSPGSTYCLTLARAVDELGYACLRLALRGADRQGEDIYHAGQVEDLHAVLGHGSLARYRRVLIVGQSLGGNLGLLAALSPELDPRVTGVAAICPPLDLFAGQQVVDAPGSWLYRRYILGNLKQIYRAVAARRPLPVSVEQVERITAIRSWDQLIVVPRYGFASTDDYYRRASLVDKLHDLRRPALVVAGLRDPLVRPWGVQGAIRHAPSALEMRWIDRGGHTYFPADLDLGQGGKPGLDHQVLRWLASRRRGRS
jgi:predicted alpha/beta-fold hydrolase